MNKAPTPSAVIEKSNGGRRALVRAAKVTGAVILGFSTLTGCFDLGQRQPGDASGSTAPSFEPPTGMAPFAEPGKGGIGIRHDFVKIPENAPKIIARTGEDVCPWSPDEPSPASPINLNVAGKTATISGVMLDLRCADFPKHANGVPKDGDSKSKHFIGFEEPTTESHAVDLGTPNLTRSPYMSDYMGVCAVQGELFEGTDGTYSRTWLAVFSEGTPYATGFVPFAEAGYASADQAAPIGNCQTR
jgi:hypothetical protein